MTEELKTCPRCGALPCDWVDNPFETPSPAGDIVERVARAIRAVFGKSDPAPYEGGTPYHEAARAALSAAGTEDWRPIETAPYDTEVEVKVGCMIFRAILRPNASMSDLDTSCDQWQAAIEGEHPPCWSGGACWASNEDEVESLQPSAWRPAPPSRAGGE